MAKRKKMRDLFFCDEDFMVLFDMNVNLNEISEIYVSVVDGHETVDINWTDQEMTPPDGSCCIWKPAKKIDMIDLFLNRVSIHDIDSSYVQPPEEPEQAPEDEIPIE